MQTNSFSAEVSKAIQRRRTTALLAAALIAVSIGCVRGPSREARVLERNAPADPYAQALQQAMVRQHLSQARGGAPGYRIGPEDLLEIRVFDYDKMDTVVRVGSSGEITVPLLGKIRAEGLSEQQLEAVLQDRLRGRYLKDPSVTVFLKEPHAGEVAIVGEVTKPGRYTLLGAKRVVDLLTEAGGMTEKAGNVAHVIRFVKEPRDETGAPDPSQSTSQVTRAAEGGADGAPHPLPPKMQRIMIDLERLLLRGEAEWNIALQPGDLVNVPAAGSVHVTGPGIKKPGTYPLTRSAKTLRQMIDEAEGLLFQADRTILIHRKAEDGHDILFKVDYRHILADGGKDIVLHGGDQVIVDQTVFRGALAAIGKGLDRILRFGLYGTFAVPIGN